MTRQFMRPELSFFGFISKAQTLAELFFGPNLCVVLLFPTIFSYDSTYQRENCPAKLCFFTCSGHIDPELFLVGIAHHFWCLGLSVLAGRWCKWIDCQPNDPYQRNRQKTIPAGKLWSSCRTRPYKTTTPLQSNQNARPLNRRCFLVLL